GLLILLIFQPDLHVLPPDVPDFVAVLLRTIGSALLIVGAAGIVAGWGLLQRYPWARLAAIALGCVNLLDMPLGTALGVYTLWVLLPATSEAEYRQMARA